ncbi:MAG: SDR family oxidoreductase [Roseibium sp.]
MTSAQFHNAYSLEGQTALVTGGGSGIGKEIARCLAHSGAKVIIAGRRIEILKGTAQDIGHGCEIAILDVADLDSIAVFEADLFARFGVIDILVNNAGNTLKKAFEDSTIAEFDQVFDVHVRGALELSRAFVRRLLKEDKRGSVLFISSMTAYIGQPNVSGYTIAKTAITGVVRGLSAEFASRGIRFNGVAPGWIDTELYRKATSGDVARQEKITSRIPMGELGQPEDIGWCCAFLSSNAAKYITGQVVLVDGGGATGF